ncbi:hypothetical protein HPB51_008234 [Rhipicephalus microplus]|uniref:Uncharacterized protein n=1 Tax=Rhipicephalus microplus TaxID=6941 RepID=A0A9J6EZ85_RHIMP|nr:hypothetical protein HPB51_008234 [Rhipicephalus microplus]
MRSARDSLRTARQAAGHVTAECYVTRRANEELRKLPQTDGEQRDSSENKEKSATSRGILRKERKRAADNRCRTRSPGEGVVLSRRRVRERCPGETGSVTTRSTPAGSESPAVEGVLAVAPILVEAAEPHWTCPVDPVYCLQPPARRSCAAELGHGERETEVMIAFCMISA